MIDPKFLHKEFVRLGREKNRITYELLALLPQIYELKIYEREGYANIYDYTAKIAGISPGVVSKALKLDGKVKDMPHLKEKIGTQGINKVAIIVGLATAENEKELAEKVEHMSKPALQEYSKEVRGKVTIKWQVELDERMMFMFLKLKKKLGKNLSNKECLRKILEILEKIQELDAAEKRGGAVNGQRKMKKSNGGQVEKIEKFCDKNEEPQRQAVKTMKIPGENSQFKAFSQKPTVATDLSAKPTKRITRYIPVHQKRHLGDHCAHPGCHRPAEIIHHPDRFSQYHSHKNLKPLCKMHHEFAHNGVSEPMRRADHKYRQCRQAALV